MSLFGKDTTSFSHLDLGILCHSSLQILSSSVRLDGKRWWTAIFRSLQRCSIGFKSGLWLGHSRTVTELLWSHSFVILAVCLVWCSQICSFRICSFSWSAQWNRCCEGHRWLHRNANQKQIKDERLSRDQHSSHPLCSEAKIWWVDAPVAYL